MRKTLGVFTILGPIVGSLGFIVMDQLLFVSGINVSLLAQPDSAIALWKTIPVLWVYSLVIAYPIGLLPAILCGLLYEKFLHNKSFGPFYSGLLGLGISSAFGSLFAQVSISGNITAYVTQLLSWGVAGFLGGLVAACAVRKKLWRPINSN